MVERKTNREREMKQMAGKDVGMVQLFSVMDMPMSHDPLESPWSSTC